MKVIAIIIHALSNQNDMNLFQDAGREAIQTFIGTALVKLATGVIGIWGTVNLYFISYLKNHGSEVSSRTNSILMLFIIIPTSFLVLLATRFSAYIGYKRIIRACAIIFTISPFVLNLSLNFYTLGIFFLFLPMLCFAVSAIPIINCLWSQFPKDLNKVSGFAILFFSLGMITWNLLFFKLVNPHNKPAVLTDNGEAYFTDEITDNIVKATNVIFAIAGTFYIIGSFLIQKKEEEKKKQPIQELKEEQFHQTLENQAENDKKEQQINNLVVGLNPEQITKKKLLTTLTDKKFILLFIIAYFVPLYIVYLVLFMKIIFMPIINDDQYLAMCSVVLTVAGMIGGPFWGYVADSKGFKKTLLLVCITDLVTKIVGLQCTEKWNIVIMYFMVGFNDRGIITIIGPGLIEIFGLEMATELIPYKGFSVFLAHLTVPIFQMALSKLLSYKALLFIFICFTIVAVYIAHYFNRYITYTPYAGKQIKIQDKQVQLTPKSQMDAEIKSSKTPSDEKIK